ncbi:hypothetical protein D3C85_250560 [compost metagenome]
MANGRDLAVLGGADAHPLDRCRAVRGVVGDQGPLQRHLHRTPRRARAQRRQQGVRPHEQLAAKAAANVGRDQPHFFARDSQRAGHVAAPPVDHLIRRPQGQRIALPCRHGRMRFHHAVGLIRRGVEVVDLHRGLCVGAFKVTYAVFTRVFLGGVLAGLATRFLFRRQVERTGRAFILHADQAAGGARLLQVFGHHQRDGLVIVLDVRPAQQRGGVHLALAQLAGVLRGNHRQHARRAARGLDVHGADAALGNGGAQHIAHRGLRRGIMLFIGVGRLARSLQGAVDAVDGMAHDFQLIDGILGGGSIEFHRVRPSLAPALHSGFLPPASA